MDLPWSQLAIAPDGNPGDTRPDQSIPSQTTVIDQTQTD